MKELLDLILFIIVVSVCIAIGYLVVYIILSLGVGFADLNDI